MQTVLTNKWALSLIGVGSITIVSLLIRGIINRKVSDISVRHMLIRTIHYLMLLANGIVLLTIWFESTISITTILGFISAGLALALHQVILNMAGWVLILIKKPFNIGDRIEYQEIIGDVIDIGIFHTVVLEVGHWVGADQSTGRLVQLPNGKIFTQPFFNYTSEFEALWDEVKILLTFSSDYKLAQQKLLSIAKDHTPDGLIEKIEVQQREMAKKYALKTGMLSPIAYVSIQESGIQVELRYLVEVRHRRTMKHQISQSILDAFATEDNISLAYPTQAIYLKDNKERSEL